MQTFTAPLDVTRRMGEPGFADFAQIGRRAKAGEPHTIKVFKEMRQKLKDGKYDKEKVSLG